MFGHYIDEQLAKRRRRKALLESIHANDVMLATRTARTFNETLTVLYEPSRQIRSLGGRRIPGMKRKHWLGEDGYIYYRDRKFHVRAKLKNRDEEGLEFLRDLLKSQIPPSRRARQLRRSA